MKEKHFSLKISSEILGIFLKGMFFKFDSLEEVMS